MIDSLLRLDGGILLWIQQSLRCPFLNALLIPLTRLGDLGAVWIAVSAVLLCFRRTRRLGVLSLLALCASLLCNNLILKNLVRRPRPWLALEGLVPLIAEKDPCSFPSGHTGAAFAACCVWAGRLGRRSAPWLIAAAAVMAFSRLYVGVHYPSDVLAGAATGAAIALLILRIDRRMSGKRPM